MKAILTKYHGPTDRRGSRISATDCDGNRVTVPYDHALSGDAVHWQAAKALCEKMDWHGMLVCGGLKNANVFVFMDGDAPYTV